MENSKKPKILYLITQGEFGGAQHYVLDLANSFKEDYETLVAFGETGKSQEFADELSAAGVSFYAVEELEREVSFTSDLRALLALRRIIRAEKPDIIHLNSSKISILGTLASIFSGAKLIYTAHGWVFNEQLPGSERTFYILAEKLTSFFKKRIICVSEYDRQKAIEHSITKTEKLAVVHNGISDREFLSAAEARQEIEKLLGQADLFSRHDLCIGSIAYLYKNKGFEYLINAIKLLVQKGLNPLLLIIGNGPELEELENLCEQLKLRSNVFFLGEQKQASRLIKAFDIYACSSLKEGFSYTIIEAMTAGLPIVATNVGGNPELITDEHQGLLAKAGDAQDLADKISRLIADPGKAVDYARAANEKALKEFRVEAMVQKTKYVYESILK